MIIIHLILALAMTYAALISVREHWWMGFIVAVIAAVANVVALIGGDL